MGIMFRITAGQLSWLKKNYRNTDTRIITEKFGITSGQLKYLVNKHRLSKSFTPKEEAWLRKKYCCTENKELSEKLGVPVYKVKYFAVVNGLSKTKEHKAAVIRRINGRPLSEEQKKWMIENYSETSNKEIAEHVGLSVGQISKLAASMGLRKSDHFIRTAPVIASRKTRAREKARITFGLPQKTKMKITKESHTKYQQRYRLKSMGYMIDEEEHVAYWDEKTKRAKQTEQGRGTKFYDFAHISELRKEYWKEFREERERYLSKRNN